jgi:hypothetical protein
MQRPPTNHNPRFAPVIHPTLDTEIDTLVVGERAWLAPWFAVCSRESEVLS